MEETNRFIKGNLWKEIIIFTLPFLLANFLQSLYGAVDLAVVGQSVGTSAVSAVSIGSQIMLIVNCLVMGLSMGGTVLIGKAIGDNDKARAGKAIENLAFISVILAIILTPIMVLLTDFLIEIMQTPADAVEQAKSYVLICSFGIPGIVGYNMTSAIIRGTGDSKTPMFFVLIATVINIVLDIVFVSVLNMDTAGAAYATIIAQFISFVVSLIYIKIKGGIVPISFRGIFKPNAKVCQDILYVGGPLALQDVIVHLSFLLITAIINTLGLVASSAVGVSEKIIGLVFIIPSSFSQASAVVCSQNLGAGEPRRTLKSMQISVILSLIFSSLVVGIIEIIPEPFIKIFDTNPDVVLASSSYIRSYVLDCVLVCMLFNLNSYLSAYKRSTLIFIHSVGATFLLRAPLSYLFSRLTTNLFVIGFAAPIATVFQIIFCIFVVRKIVKKRFLYSKK